MNRREFLKTGLGALFGGLLAKLGLAKAEEPTQLEQVAEYRHGKTWYIDWAKGTDKQGYGLSPDTPLTTVEYALNVCNAPRDDIVILMPEEPEPETIHVKFTESEEVFRYTWNPAAFVELESEDTEWYEPFGSAWGDWVDVANFKKIVIAGFYDDTPENREGWQALLRACQRLKVTPSELNDASMEFLWGWHEYEQD